MVRYLPNLVELRLLGVLPLWMDVADTIGTFQPCAPSRLFRLATKERRLYG